MNNCKTCKFWDKYEWICNKVNKNTINDNFYLNIKANDDQGLFVSLKTSPDFGCSQWMIKDINHLKDLVLGLQAEMEETTGTENFEDYTEDIQELEKEIKELEEII